MQQQPTLESGGRTDLTVQVTFRGVVIDHVTLRHRPRTARRDRYQIPHRDPARPATADVTGGASPPPEPHTTRVQDTAAFTLVEDTPAGLRVHLMPDMRGSAAMGVLQIPLATWRANHGSSFLLPTDVALELAHGQMEYRLAWVAPAPPVRAPLVRLRWQEQRYTAATALAFLLVLLASALVPPDARALSLQRLVREFRLLPVTIVPPEEQERARASGAHRAKAGAAARGAPGAAGQPAARPRDAAVVRKLARRERAGDASARLQAIQHSGILEFFRTDVPDSAIAALLSPDSALGDDPRTILGVLERSNLADGYGVGGLTVRGTGVAGAGTGESTIGTGSLGRISLGIGDGVASDRGGGIGRLAPRRERPLDVVAERPTVRGSLDREIIRRVVRRHINEIRYCYEQELPRAPSLAGRVAVRFTIAATGSVAAAAVDSSSLANPRVEICTVDAVRRWSFPQPQGGGIVIATYPFTFVPAGGDR
jgi:TonB family protein